MRNGLPSDCLLLLRNDANGLQLRARILTLRIFLQGLHHVPYGEQGHGGSVKCLHLDTRLVRRLDGCSRDNPVCADFERHAREGDRNRRPVRQDLPNGLHCVKPGHLRGSKRIAFLDTTCANRTDRRSLEADGCGGHRAAANIRFPSDVNHFRHGRWATGPALFHHALFVKATAGMRSLIDGAPRARARDVVKSWRPTREGLSTMRGRRVSCVRKGMRARRDGKGDRSAGSWSTILSPRHRDLRNTTREGEKERRNMIRRKTAVAVLIAVIVGAAFAAYTFRPRATNSSVAVNQPGTDNGNPGGGTTPSTPATPPAKASEGPKHAMCVHENDHIPDNARVHGANWYRFYDRAACTALQSLEDFVSIF